MRRDTIKTQIERIKKRGSHRDDETGMLFNRKEQLKRKYSTITLYGLFISDESTWLVRPHVFEKKTALSPSEWNAWLGRNYNADPGTGEERPGILFQILAGMSARTNKQWRLYAIIGWVPENDNLKLGNTSPRRSRNKKKSPRK